MTLQVVIAVAVIEDGYVTMNDALEAIGFIVAYVIVYVAGALRLELD